jgi:hypothetical protein
MIVIPTYNGYWSLTRLIHALEKFGTGGHKVVVVDDKTTDLVSVKYLQQLKAYTGSLDLHVLQPETKPGYEAGCVVAAYRAFPEEEKVILLQDSCSPTSEKWLSQFEEKLTPDNVVTWVRFKPCLFFCNEKHLEYIDTVCGGHNNVPSGGFFGNIFMAYTKHLKMMDEGGFFEHLPKAKYHSEAWERIWAILFHLHGIRAEAIIDLKEGDWFGQQIPSKIHNGMFPHLKKSFQGRAG